MKPDVVRRKAPDFGFDHEGIPTYWFAGDAFKTRFFDAMSTMFPEGEKYFIESVRAYREQITDPAMLNAVADFTYQEAQHSLAHRQYNDRLKTQGIDVDRYERAIKAYIGFVGRYLPKSVNLANTAAAEHLTAIMSHLWMQADVHRDSDVRMRALYHWHSIEEIEHKSVAFDVLKQVARVGYLTRVTSMAYESVAFPISVFLYVDDMLKVDGFSRRERATLWRNGLRWLFGREGLLRMLLPSYLAYYRPDFHPWQAGSLAEYRSWRERYEQNESAIDAARAGSAAA